MKAIDFNHVAKLANHQKRAKNFADYFSNVGVKLYALTLISTFNDLKTFDGCLDAFKRSLTYNIRGRRSKQPLNISYIGVIEGNDDSAWYHLHATAAFSLWDQPKHDGELDELEHWLEGIWVGHAQRKGSLAYVGQRKTTGVQLTPCKNYDASSWTNYQAKDSRREIGICCKPKNLRGKSYTRFYNLPSSLIEANGTKNMPRHKKSKKQIKDLAKSLNYSPEDENPSSDTDFLY